MTFEAILWASISGLCAAVTVFALGMAAWLTLKGPKGSIDPSMPIYTPHVYTPPSPPIDTGFVLAQDIAEGKSGQPIIPRAIQ